MTDSIATYTFLPWLRQGISSQITGADNLGSGAGPGERAAVSISIEVNGDPDFISKNVQLIGPGDVIGINSRVIVRTEPRHWVTDFEPNYLAFIEFYEEDFPWRFTPARAEGRDATGNPSTEPSLTKLRPWIFLLVLEEGEFEERPAPSAPLAAITLTVPPDGVLPPPAQTWAWAHVHVSRDITGGDTGQTVAALEQLLKKNPDYALSRLVSPRRLKPSTAYHAFLIPTFEVGRLAGLGQATAGLNALKPAWGAGQVEYPFYYRWFFRTGLRGDFEYLVRLLEPREVDDRVGIRDMDMQKPDFGVVGMGAGPNELPVMGLEGALKSPSAKPNPIIWPPKNRNKYPAFLTRLEEVVNLQEALLRPPGASGHPDPIISPPLYGRWHALQHRLAVGRNGWVNELNQDPRLRVPAGFGTQVIQTGQEGYMQRAWRQLGDILRANQKIRQVQVSIAAGERIFTRHFANLEPEQQVAVTRQVHARVMASPRTVYQEIRERRLEQAAVQPAFRRLLRPRGAVLRRAFPKKPVKPAAILGKINEGEIKAASAKEAPKEQISLTNIAKKLGSQQLLEENLRVDNVRKIPLNPDFRFSSPGELSADRPLGIPLLDSPEGSNFRAALLDLHDRLEISLPAPDTRDTLNIGAVSSSLARALRPKIAILQRIRTTVFIPEQFRRQIPNVTIQPIMAHPVFADPMYRPLRDLSSELLIPNLNLIPNNTITLLETNPRFIEAYMTGLNHEMARELLWREYPTDQRGSYFRQFWDVSDIVDREKKDARVIEEELRDIIPLHLWDRKSDLGTHENRNMPTGNEPEERKLVLVIRGDLLKRYPTAIIFAHEAEWVPSSENPDFKIRNLKVGDPKTTIKDPIFKAEIEPDLQFLGFDLTAEKAKGHIPTPEEEAAAEAAGEEIPAGWFFVIQERPGEPRFGMDLRAENQDLPKLDELYVWNHLTWEHLRRDGIDVSVIDVDSRPESAPHPAIINRRPTPDETELEEAHDRDIKIQWGSNAADMAYILFQAPAMVAIHADNMLK
jgi:peptidoglycan hydrolase-like protein with peptidoglycan-binding domain